MTLGGIEKIVRGQNAELLRGQADQHLDDQRRIFVAQRNDGLQVQSELILAQRSVDQFEQAFFTLERCQVLGEFVVRTHVLEAQRRDHRGIGSRAHSFGHRLVTDLEHPQGFGEHGQYGREFSHACATLVLASSETGEDHQSHATEFRALEHGKGTTCASGICALPPQAVRAPAHVMRIFDDFGDQRVVFREQEVAARPERIAPRVVDRQGENFGSAAHETARQRREQRSGCFICRRVVHTWRKVRRPRRRHRRRDGAT